MFESARRHECIAEPQLRPMQPFTQVSQATPFAAAGHAAALTQRSVGWGLGTRLQLTMERN